MKCPWKKGDKITNGDYKFTILEVFPDDRVKYQMDDSICVNIYYDNYRDLINLGYRLSNSEQSIYDAFLSAAGNIVDELMTQHYGKQVTDIKEGDILVDSEDEEYEVRLIMNGLYFLVSDGKYAMTPLTKFEVDGHYTPKPKKRDVNDLISKVLGMMDDGITYRF